ncbi:MAG: protease modulator HflC [Rhodospirillales bacterium]
MKLSLAILGLVVMITGAVLSGAMFTVTEKNQAIVLQFGNPKRVITDPGLYFKIPFIQDLVYYDKRILDLDPPFEQLTLKDKKRINVDTYARYRITDPLAFFTSARTESGFLSNFGPILNGSVRNEMGKHPLVNLLSKKRDDIMELIQGRASKAAKRFGVMVVDVRIGRTDLPEEISKNVYERMRSERIQEANELRAEGDEIKIEIMSNADRKKTIILAEANKKSQILRGEGEAGKTSILAQAHKQGREFFDFIRSMEAMRKGLNADDTSLVLSPDSEFFRFFTNPLGRKKMGKQ